MLFALVLEGQKYAARHLAGPGREQETPTLLAARQALARYFAGQRPDFSQLPLSPRGSAFQRRVWQALCRIPYGETRSYGQLARALDSSPRAVGAAVSRNPLLILVPCHRCLGADGSLTGFAAGLDAKRQLLALEGVLPE